MSKGLLNLLRHLADARASRIRETERKRFQRHINRPFALDIERLEERNSIADALGPALTTSALSIMGQMMELVAPEPLPQAQAGPGAGTTVSAAGITDTAVLQVVLPERPEGPKNVSGGIDPGPTQSPVTSFQQPAEAFGNPWQGKPLYADFAQNTLLIDLNAAAKSNSAAGIGAGSDNLGGGSGGGGSAGQSSPAGSGNSTGGTADSGASAADLNHGGGGGGGLPSLTSPTTSPAANSGSDQIASSPTTSTTAATFASPTSGVDGVAASSPLAPSSGSPTSPSGIVSPTGGTSTKKKKDALWVLDANNALVITPGVTEHDFSNYPVDLRAQVTGGTVSTYSWDFTNAPDATSISGSSTYRTQFTWANFTGADRTDSITLTVNTGSQTSQTLTFDVASTTSPAYTATPPVSTSTWPAVLPPDALTRLEVNAGGDATTHSGCP